MLIQKVPWKWIWFHTHHGSGRADSALHKRRSDGADNLLSSALSLLELVLYWILLIFCGCFSPSMDNETTTFVLFPVVCSCCRREWYFWNVGCFFCWQEAQGSLRPSRVIPCSRPGCSVVWDSRQKTATWWRTALGQSPNYGEAAE